MLQFKREHATLISQFVAYSKKNRNKKNVMKLKNTLDNSEEHSNENEDFVLLPASKDILQSNDPKSNNQNTNHAKIPIESLHKADENNKVSIFSNAKFMLFIFLLILSLFLLHLFLVCSSVSLSKGGSFENIPDPPPFTTDEQFNKAVDCIRSFELKEMNYNIYSCSICNKTRIDMKIKNNICDKCQILVVYFPSYFITVSPASFSSLFFCFIV
jgi:hypothetical protein